MIVVPKHGVSALDQWLESDRKYPVLAISSASTGSKFLLWSARHQTAALFPSGQFDVVDQTLPAIWVARVDLNGYVEISPREWQVDGFWESYHDEDPEAVRTFERCFETLTSGSSSVG